MISAPGGLRTTVICPVDSKLASSLVYAVYQRVASWRPRIWKYVFGGKVVADIPSLKR